MIVIKTFVHEICFLWNCSSNVVKSIKFMCRYSKTMVERLISSRTGSARPKTSTAS
jgi:hypothetical protein